MKQTTYNSRKYIPEIINSTIIGMFLGKLLRVHQCNHYIIPEKEKNKKNRKISQGNARICSRKPEGPSKIMLVQNISQKSTRGLSSKNPIQVRPEHLGLRLHYISSNKGHIQTSQK